MHSVPKISVVTVCYNSEHTIRETIESVANQDYPNLEHLIVDGGSKDRTLDIVREHPHLLWTSEKDKGIYDAMNKGIRRATGDIVVMLNSDDCFRGGALLSVGKAFRDHPEWDGLFGDIIYVDSQGREIFRRAEAVFDYDVLRFSGVCYVIHPTLFVKKSVHDRLGLYRNEDLVNCADFEFMLRMGKAGCRIGHIPEFLVNFRIHDFGMTADKRVARNIAREHLKLMIEHGYQENMQGKALRLFYRAKRQWQKLIHRGKCDVIPGHLHLNKHMKEKTEFSSHTMPKGA